jgi:hypothetical protein
MPTLLRPNSLSDFVPKNIPAYGSIIMYRITQQLL